MPPTPSAIHDVFNQSPPFEDVDLFALDRPLAGEAGSANGEARICKLFEGVVALFAAGRGRAGL